MSAGRSFRSLFMAATCATAALGCYLVSLRVASERAALEAVETRIVLAQRDVRVLQTEIGTRGRLAQLERWNAKVLALSAPSADQFLSGSFELAKLARPDERPVIDAPVVLATAPAPDSAKSLIGQDGSDDSGQPKAHHSKVHAQPGKFEDRDARGPGNSPRRISCGGSKEVHGSPGYGGEAGFSPTRGYTGPRGRQTGTRKNPWISRSRPSGSR